MDPWHGYFYTFAQNMTPVVRIEYFFKWGGKGYADSNGDSK